jgi:hypothetical protein
MDIEFHYYMTYLIAARAGFSPAQASLIAQSAQEIDDNHIPVSVSGGTPAAYENAISQTMNILHPHHNEKIYPIFHFIPGDPDAPSARRKDDRRSSWVTTPDSPLANEMLQTALKSGDLYRIGASSHAYADTWAHQNFVGKDDVCNEIPDGPLLDRIEGRISLLRIGHALAGHAPDIPGLIWTDGRLADPTVDNTTRFLDAANHLFRRLCTCTHGNADVAGLAASLVNDLKADIGPSSKVSVRRDQARIARYRQRALKRDYGSTAIPDYREAQWADAAFVEKHGGVAEKLAKFVAHHTGLAGDILEFGTRMEFNWQDPDNYSDTHWYKFQEAVKSHRDECWSVLERRIPELAK